LKYTRGDFQNDLGNGKRIIKLMRIIAVAMALRMLILVGSLFFILNFGAKDAGVLVLAIVVQGVTLAKYWRTTNEI
jgi:hypothetical protein